MMKKLNLKMLAMLFTAFVMSMTFVACDDDDDPDPVECSVDCPNDMEVLVTDDAFELSGATPEGGTYYLNGAEITTFDPAAQGEGVHKIVYERTDADNCTAECDFRIIVAAPAEYVTLSGSITEDMTLDNTKKYLIDGFVFVEDGATLTIPAGTLIEAEPGQGENASALIVQMGGKIEANGTADEPIIITGLGDGKEGNYLKDVQGLWGGLILLGKAETNNTIRKRIEGIPEEYNAFYGFDNNAGADNNDNSGTLKYVSIRHGGTDIGAGNEINGISFGAVGAGTTVEYIEVISNKDDGLEFFGGVAQVRNALVALVGDDSFDTDEGFRGKGQFWCAIQGDETGDRLAEQDGGTGDDEENPPYAQPTYYNFTYVGHGFGNFVIFRDNAAGIYANSIFAHGEKGLRIEYRDDKHSSYDWLVDANPEATLMIKNNLFDNIAEKNIYAKAESGELPADHETVTNNLFNNNENYVETTGVTADAPVPAAASANPLAPLPGDDFFQAADYHGAFQPGGANWADGWTLMFK